MVKFMKTSGDVVEADQPAPKPAKTGGELAAVLKTIEKDKGPNIVYVAKIIPQVKRLPSGVFEFDLATGGGFPFGRLSQVYGPESSGKSNITYGAIRQAQKLPGPCNRVVYFDLEGTFDPKWVAQFGVDMDALMVIKPRYGEEAVDLIIACAQASDVALIIVDSIAMFTKQKEVEQSTETGLVGGNAMLIGRMCNKLGTAFATEGARDHFPAVVFINQTRFKIGVLHGDPETYPGGQALRFLLSLVVRLYGKNKVVKEIHPELAVYKETNAVIKKAKIGVIQSKFTYDLCVVPFEGMAVGETDTFKQVTDYLRALGRITSEKVGYCWAGETVVDKKTGEATLFPYKTLADMKVRYRSEDDFRLALQREVIDDMSGNQMLIAES